MKRNFNVLMISYGGEAYINNFNGVIDRHLIYASYLEKLTIICLTKNKYKAIKKNNLEIIFTSSSFIIKILFDAIKLLRRISLNDKKYDLVTTQDPFITALVGLYVKYTFKVPLIIQNHSSFIDNKIWFSEKPLTFRLLNILAKRMIIRADRLRVVNQKEKNKYVNKIGLNENKIDVIPVPMNTEFWTQKVDDSEIENFKYKYNIKNDCFILGWAGRFVEGKNIELLYQILNKLKGEKINLILAGDYLKSKIDLKKYEKEYKVKPVYIGVLDQNEMKVFYNSINLYLSSSKYEGFGLSVAYAQLASKPVIAFEADGPKDIIIDGITGFLINNNDVNIYIEKIKQLMYNHTLYSNISLNAGVISSQKYSSVKMLEQLLYSFELAVNNYNAHEE